MMHPLLAKLHRSLTLRHLKRQLDGKTRPCARPVPGRLLYVAASCLPYHISGYTTRTHEILCALRDAGVDLRVLTRTGYPWDRADRLDEAAQESTLRDGILYEHARSPRNNCFTALYAARASKAIARHAVRHQVGRIHAASNHVNALPALLAARRLGIPFQYEMRGLWELTRASRMPEFENSHNFHLGLELEGLVAAHADRLFVISDQLGRFAQQEWGIGADKIRLLPNCVDAARLTPPPPGDILPHSIGYAGSLIGYEGLDTLMTALGLLRDSGCPARLEIVGHGEERAQLEAQASRLRLEAQVRFHGKMPPHEARALLSRCALACIPRKPYAVCRIVPPLKLVEAFALGMPVVVPDLPVFRDEAGDTAGAFFFQSGDVVDLARVLKGALADPVRLHALGRQARAHALAHRQWRDHIAHITEEY